MRGPIPDPDRGLNLTQAKKKGLQRLLYAFGYTFAGLKAAWISEEAFRQEIVLLLFVIPLGIWLGESGIQRAVLIGFYLNVPLAELLNSSIETIVDRIGEEHHALSGKAKDLGSAAVFVSICTAVITWSIIAWERFL